MNHWETGKRSCCEDTRVRRPAFHKEVRFAFGLSNGLRCIWLRTMTRCREVFLLYKDLPCERRSDEWESSELGAYFIGTPFGYTFTPEKAGWALPRKLGGKRKGE